jgi:CubicO group peptidase (beta-lactamase class C family)
MLTLEMHRPAIRLRRHGGRAIIYPVSQKATSVMPIRPAYSDLLRIASMIGLVLFTAVARAEDYPVGSADSMWHDPYMIGSYRHWDEIYPVRNIPRSGPVSTLAYATPIENLAYMRGTTERSIDEYFELSRATGLVVIRDDAIVFERYALGADEASKFTSMSVAKSIVSTLVGFAIDDGLIESVDDPIDRYIPELAGTGYEGVPIKAILQMSSGIAFIEDYTASVSDSTRLWLETAHYRSTPLNTFVTQMERRQEPFADFNYKGVDTAALGWLIAAVTGRSLSAYAAEKLWAPLGMEADANWGVDGRGEAASEIAFCCLQATLRDFARFGLFMLHRGDWNGTDLLSSGWVETATRLPSAGSMPAIRSVTAINGGFCPATTVRSWPSASTASSSTSIRRRTWSSRQPMSGGVSGTPAWRKSFMR